MFMFLTGKSELLDVKVLCFPFFVREGGGKVRVAERQTFETVHYYICICLFLSEMVLY